MDYMDPKKLEEMKKIEDFRSKVLKYIVYKKRTESEIRKKFENEDQDLLDDTIEYFIEQKYINDEDYIKIAVNEYIALLM